ncbi:lanosterol 14-alpha-demethylase [Cladochytrium tenue]|nr:lanosterol 14-alpha-demethylase [Cladochytrium tenue]
MPSRSVVASFPAAAAAALAVAVAAAPIVAFALALRARRRILPTIPRPDGWLPVFGHGLLFLGGNDAAVASFEKFAWELGPLYVVELGAGNQVLCVADAELIMQLMRRRHTETSPSSSFKASLESLNFGHNIALVEDYDDWKGLRRIIEPPFTPSNMKKMAPFILRAAKNLGSEFDKIAEMQASEIAAHPRPGEFTGTTAVDLGPILKKATFDTMMMYAFDLDHNQYSKKLSLEDVDRAISGTLGRIRSIFKLYRFYLTAEDRQTQTAAQRVRETSFKIIEEARQRVEAGGASEIREHSVLDNFIKSQSLEEQKIAKLSVDSLADNVFALLFAGYDTTASTFNNILRVLAKYPDVQEHIHAEAISVLKAGWEEGIDSASGEAANMSFDPKTLPYIHAFIKEVNRLYPLSAVNRMNTKTDVNLGGHLIPAGTPLLLISRVAALRASALSDGFVFRPERWLEMENNKELREAESKTIMSFGGGARICPGRHAAIAQLVVFTAATAARFKVSFLDVPPHLELSRPFLQRPIKFEKRVQK